MKRICSVLSLVFTVTLGLAAADDSWLPAPVADGMVEQLAGRMKSVGIGNDDADRLSHARDMVAALHKELDDWGERGVMAEAPTFPKLTLPSSGNRHLDVMARYQVCNMILMVQLNDPDFRDDRNARATSTIGVTGVTMAIIRLRQPFMAQGGDPNAIERFLTDPGFEPVMQAIQAAPEVRAHIETQCQPVVVKLVVSAMQ